MIWHDVFAAEQRNGGYHWDIIEVDMSGGVGDAIARCCGVYEKGIKCLGFRTKQEAERDGRMYSDTVLLKRYIGLALLHPGNAATGIPGIPE